MSSLVQALRRASARLSRGAHRCSSTAAEAPSHPVVRSDSHGFHPEHLNEIPAGFAHAPLVLGVAGAIPFVALAAPVRPLLDDYVPSALFPAARSAGVPGEVRRCDLVLLGRHALGLGLRRVRGRGRGRVRQDRVRARAPRRAPRRSGARFAYGVVPSLVAWAALAMPLPQQLAAVSLSLVAALGADAAFASERMMPRWLMPLRFGLTGTAAVCLLASVPAAIEAQREELKREAENRELRRRAPKTREALARASGRSPPRNKPPRRRGRRSRALEAELDKADRRAEGAEAELRMTQGARGGGGGGGGGAPRDHRRGGGGGARARPPRRRGWRTWRRRRRRSARRRRRRELSPRGRPRPGARGRARRKGRRRRRRRRTRRGGTARGADERRRRARDDVHVIRYYCDEPQVSRGASPPPRSSSASRRSGRFARPALRLGFTGR